MSGMTSAERSELLKGAVLEYVAAMHGGSPTACRVTFDAMANLAAQGDEAYDPEAIVGPLERRWFDNDLLEIMDVLNIPETEQERDDQPWTRTILEWLKGGSARWHAVLAADAMYDTGASVDGLWNRETLGMYVRHIWLEWAHREDGPKPSWLVEWPALPEHQKEVDRQIGERLYAAGAAVYRAALEEARNGLQGARSIISAYAGPPRRDELTEALWGWASGLDSYLWPLIVSTLESGGYADGSTRQGESNQPAVDGARVPRPAGTDGRPTPHDE